MNEPRDPHYCQTRPLPGRWRPLLLISVVAALHGCSTLGSSKHGEEKSASKEAGAAPLSFKVDVVSDNRRIARHLERYLDIQRFSNFPDLQAGELRRLLGEAESNSRDLLAALGYFTPQLNLKAGEPAGESGMRRIVIEVDPGEQTKIESHDIRFAEPMNSDPISARQRRAIQRDWLLKDNDPFTQEAWDASKTAGLRALQRERYPTARIADSRATVNADTSLAGLQVTYDAGAPYRFGALKLEGVERYDAEGIPQHRADTDRRRLPRGRSAGRAAAAGQQRLLRLRLPAARQQRAQSRRGHGHRPVARGQNAEDRVWHRVQHRLRPAVVRGPHHNEMWPLGWRALNQVEAGTNTQSLATNWTDMPKASGWSWNTGLKLERSDYGDIKANSVSLTGGRSRTADKTERRYYLQYDASNAEGSEGPHSSSSLMGNYAWTGRYFNDRVNPTRGHGIAAEAGLGLTVTPEREPFLRLDVRALQLWPFGGRNTAGKRSRLALRAEVGAVFAGDSVNIPANLLFLTGGDTTVRGYSYQSIGTRLDDGSIYGARYMAMGSVEWQRPITVFGDAGNFEHTLFVDAGTASDKLGDAVLFPGVGTGIRWSSPVGPLQIDVAYGTKTQKWRLHLRVGFQF